MDTRRILVVCSLLTVAVCHREHKVHNIVLYPDKHSWCKTTPIKQVVAFPGCNSVEIDNNVCVGACFSYSIPRTSPAAPGELIKPYCDSCQPSAVRWQHVTLECEDVDKLQKRVQIINNCSCSSCEQVASPLQPIAGSGEGEVGLDHKHSRPDVGDLINLSKGPAPGSTGGDGVQVVRRLGEDETLDMAAVQELMRQAEHKVNHTLLDGHIKVNVEKLRHKPSHHNPTLDVAHDHFKPALEGSELSYQDNPAQQDDNEF